MWALNWLKLNERRRKKKNFNVFISLKCYGGLTCPNDGPPFSISEDLL